MVRNAFFSACYFRRGGHAASDEEQQADNHGNDPNKILERVYAGSAEHFNHGVSIFPLLRFCTRTVLKLRTPQRGNAPRRVQKLFQVIFVPARLNIIRQPGSRLQKCPESGLPPEARSTSRNNGFDVAFQGFEAPWADTPPVKRIPGE
jgi:hypothetical protein